MSGWSLVPDSPQNSPQSPPSSSGGWTPVESTPAPQKAAEPQESAFGELLDMGRLGKALIQSKMLGMGDPQLAYKYQENIEKQLHDIGGDFMGRMGKASKVEDDPISLAIRKRVPEPFESHDKLENFVHDVSELAKDPVQYLPAVIGAALGGAGGATKGANVGFTLDAGLRQMLTDRYSKGEATSFGEIASRAAKTIEAAAIGYGTGKSMEFAGELPAGNVPVASHVLRGLYQSSAVAVIGDLLSGQTPTLEHFERAAVTVTGLNLITGGLASTLIPDSKQGMMDVYAKDGTTPEQTATKLQAQPPVKPAQPEGLQSAIRITAKDGSKQVITGDAGESHEELAKRVTGESPVSLDELNGDPKQADKVLSQPEIQDQSVIDRAYELKDEQGEELPTTKPLSGRGFASINGDYMSRMSARRWVKTNEPEVHDMWANITGDEKSDFHSGDYNEARQRVGQRNVMEGEPQLTGISAELQKFLAGNRTELNEVKSGNKGEQYGSLVVRNTVNGPENMIHAFGEQFGVKFDKLIPDSVDQEALSFMRDYRDDPNQLRSRIEEIRGGDNESLKAFIPAMERALEPTPQMLEADKQMTDYFTQANNLRTQFGGVGSSIDPERYSPRNFMRAEEDQQQSRGVGASRFSKRSPHDIQRQYEHVLDPLMSGDIKARTFNAVDEMRVYNDRLAKSIARSVFEMELKNTELGKFGTPGMSSDLRERGGENLSQSERESLGGIPSNWVELPGTSRGGRAFYVPPKVADAVGPMFEPDALSSNKYWRLAKLGQSWVKGMELSLSVFHLRALSISFMNNNGLDGYVKALFSDNKSPQFEFEERDGALHGLITSKTTVPYEAWTALRESSLPSRKSMLELARSAPGLKQLDQFSQGASKFIFDTAQRKFKVIDYATHKAAWLAKNPNATDVEYGSAMRSIAKEVNAVYGGLNWENMGHSKTIRAVSRMYFLAPDWTFSNVANLKYTAESGPGGNAARAFWVKSFITGFALSAAASYFFTGKSQDADHWDQVHMGADANGHEMYSNIFFAGAPKDLVTLWKLTAKHGAFTGPALATVNKAGPLVGTPLRMVMNKDWEGKPIEPRKGDFIDKTVSEGKFAGEQNIPLPFLLKDLTDRMFNPDKDLSYKDAMTIITGAPVIHEGESRKQSKTKKRGYSLAGSR